MIELLVLGNIGKDPTVNTVNGKTVINFSVAVTEKWKDVNGNQNEKTRWIDCALWRETGNIAQYIVKGNKIFVKGVPDVSTYQKPDGSVVATQKLRVTYVELLGGAANKPQQETQSSVVVNQDDLGLPF